MEHYDWNDGWLFAPTFDPAIVRPECTGVELEPVRLPHTVKTLPYNYCNENEYQRVSVYGGLVPLGCDPFRSANHLSYIIPQSGMVYCGHIFRGPPKREEK